MDLKRKPGRPRKWESSTEQAREWKRAAKDRSGDEKIYQKAFYLALPEVWRIDRLSEAWGCTKSEAVTRLLRIAFKNPEIDGILFPKSPSLS